MFCAFAGPPRIVRLHGRGTVVLPGDGDWEELANERGQLADWAGRKTEDDLAEYRAKRNAVSIDGLPGLAE